MTADNTASVLTFPPRASAQPAATPDPLLVLDIDQIEPYDHNPRLVRNPKWQAIEASIKASQGLTEPLSVTKRPGEANYVVHQGGNTRLLILKKLHRKTADDRFRQVRVELQPYTSELDLAALHDRENTCRGDLLYVEQAWSKHHQYQLYCQQKVGKPTARAFVGFLRKTYGDATTAQAFSRMQFVVNILYQHIPTCLVQGGMSMRAVRHLISVRTATEKIWVDREVGTKADFESVFYELLQRQDRDLAETFLSDDRDAVGLPDARIGIDWAQVKSDLSHEIAIVTDADYQTASAWLGSAFRSGAASAAPSPIQPVVDAEGCSERPASRDGARPPSILDLRNRAFKLVRRLASRGGVGDLIEATPNQGFGYRMAAPASSAQLSAASKACWWALCLGSALPGQSSSDARTASMGEISIAELSADGLSIWAKLLTIHALLMETAGGPLGLRSPSPKFH